MNLETFDASGHSFQVRPNDSDIASIREVFVRKGYERRDFAILPSEKWLDCGANIGAFSRRAHLLGAQVVAVEPSIQNLKVLRTNLEGTAIQVYACAVGGKSRLENFYECGGNSWRSTLFRPRKHSSSYPVDVRTLDDLVKETGSDCVKLDVEGAEREIIEQSSCLDTLSKLVFEYHYELNSLSEVFPSLVARLRSAFPFVVHRKLGPAMYAGKIFPPCFNVFCHR